MLMFAVAVVVVIDEVDANCADVVVDIAVDVDMGVVHLPKVCAVKSLPKKEISLVNLVFFQRPKIEVCMSAHHTRFNIQPKNALIGKHLPCTKRDMWQGWASNKMKKVAGFTWT